MSKGKCPVCGCEKFYVKDPDDEYNCSEFQFIDGRPVGEDDETIDMEAEAYCDRCTWHAPMDDIPKG